MDHQEVYGRITSILDGEDDWVAAMATVACELHNAFDHYHWTGFYNNFTRNVENWPLLRRAWVPVHTI